MSLTGIEDISDACFKQFSALIHDMMGITIRSDRRAMLAGRVRSRMRELKLSSYDCYFDYVINNKEEHRPFTDAITTNETYFYRTPRIWNYISDDFLPDWYARHSGERLNIWSGASSTGEEAYTLGIVMQQFKDQHRGFDYQILGTDIAPRVLDHAIKGLYKGRAIERFRKAKPELFARYMTGDDNSGFRVVAAISKNIRFEVFNLFDKNSKKPCHDLILLRNVLIYFTKEDQKTVMANLHRRLTLQGIAIIGESETLNNLNTNYEPVMPTIYRALIQSGHQKAA